MQFHYRPIPSLPPLAWCARVEPENDVVVVLHGSAVETRPRGFIEGAWNGAFSSLDLAAATIVAGTGAIVEPERVRFVASTDQSGPLFSIAKGGSTYVANSPAFVMAVTDEAPDDVYPFYTYDLVRIFRQGLQCPSGHLMLGSTTSLRVHYTTIINVDRRGSVTFEKHRLSEPPDDYRSYKEQLVEGTRKVVENAADPARRRRYRPLAALSKGYDSTAAAALAAAAGCTEAYTFADPRLEDPAADSGEQNANLLGMACKVYGRWDYLDLGGVEAEFGYATTASKVPIAAAADQLAGHMFIGGEYGDAIWDPAEAEGCDQMSRPSIGYTMGLSAIEFRLRVGYYLFAPACIAARHNRAIHRIAMSEEMRPWSLGGDYDRPIPRRIAEEAGVPRDRFGVRKLASDHSHLVFPRRFSKQGLEDYRRFADRRHAGISPDLLRYWRSRMERRHATWDALAAARREPYFPPPIRVPWEFAFTFQWAVASTRKRYAAETSRPDDAVQDSAAA